MSFNTPHMDGHEDSVKRYVHSELAVEHSGIHAKIQSNGRVSLSKSVNISPTQVEVIELDIPASLVFKLATLLKATRKVEYVGLVGNSNPSER
jgi:hypothetical protein